MNIYTDGIYDIFHRGHIESFKTIKELYPECRLIVGVVNDVDSRSYKRMPVYDEDDRYTIIENIKFVDRIVKNAPLVIDYKFIRDNNIDLVVHGFSDQTDIIKQQEFFKIPIELGIFKEIKYYDRVSTSSIIHKIKNIN